MDEETQLPIPISPRSPPSLKQKLKQSLCFYCCFRRRHRSFRPPPPPSTTDDKPTLIWLETMPPSHDLLADFKHLCRAIFSRRFCNQNKHRKHFSSTEFNYDPLSYSLNFEDGFGDSHLDETPLRSFSSRLPPSPPPEIAAVA